MFGSFFDRVYAKIKPCGKTLTEPQSEMRIHGDLRSTWIYFLPDVVYSRKSIRDRLSVSNALLHYISLSHGAVQEDPVLTRKHLEDVMAVTDEKVVPLAQKPVSVVGVSMGNVPAFRYANTHAVDTLYSIVGGSDLVDCIFSSALTRKIVHRTNHSREKFERELSVFNPYNNLEGLDDTKIYMHYGTHDVIVPSRIAVDLKDAINERGIENQTMVYSRSGHVETMAQFLFSLDTHFH